MLEALSNEQVADLASELDTDDAVAIIEDMDVEDQREVLRAMEPDDRAAIEEALSYPEESAGRLMQRELIAVPEHWNVGDVLDYLRGNGDLTTDFWEIFVVDHGHHPVGTCKLSWILRSQRDVPVAEMMQREQTLIPVDMDQEEVALRFQKYALISAAVVDHSGRLVGMITVDDVVHIIQEEAGEDALRLSGAGDGDINEPIQLDRAHAPDVAADQPADRDAGGGRGRPLRWRDRALRAARGADGDRHRHGRQCRHADAGGGGARARDQPAHRFQHAAHDRPRIPDRGRQRRCARPAHRRRRLPLSIIICALGLVVFGLAILINNLVAGLAGVLVPLTLEKMKVDPAVSSAVFVTMFTDCMGFFVVPRPRRDLRLHG